MENSRLRNLCVAKLHAADNSALGSEEIDNCHNSVTSPTATY